MSVLGSSVLGLQAVVLLLGIPVGLSLADHGAATAVVLGLAALLAVLAAGMIRRRPQQAVLLGWVVQAVSIASGFLLPAMFFVGLLFGAVWWTAVHFGRKVDAIRAQYDAPLPD